MEETPVSWQVKIINLRVSFRLMEEDDFRVFAEYYDVFYLERKDYEKEAKIVEDIIKKLGSKKSGTLLDVGCGTAHIIQELATDRKRSELVGLDVSKAMLKVAKGNCSRLDNIGLVVADGLKLPFPDQAFDIITTRLAEYSPTEAYRVLKEGGFSLNTAWDRKLIKRF